MTREEVMVKLQKTYSTASCILVTEDFWTMCHWDDPTPVLLRRLYISFSNDTYMRVEDTFDATSSWGQLFERALVTEPVPHVRHET